MTATVRRVDDPQPLPVAIEPGVDAVFVVERGASILAVAVVDPRGAVHDPDDPTLRIVYRDAAVSIDELIALIEACLAALRAANATRVTLGWDPMDAPGLKRLARLGFSPTGVMPYFLLGGEQVEFVTGYMDVSGSTLDLAWTA